MEPAERGLEKLYFLYVTTHSALTHYGVSDSFVIFMYFFLFYSFQAAVTEYHRLGDIQGTEIYFSWALEAEASKIEALAGSGLGEGLLAHSPHSSRCVLTWQKRQGSSLGSLIRALIPS